MHVTVIDGVFVASSSPQYVTRGQGVRLQVEDVLEMLVFSDAMQSLVTAEMKHWNSVILPRRRAGSVP